MDLPSEVVSDLVRRDAEEEIEVHDDNWLIFDAFAALATQWRIVATMGPVIYQGLDYVAVPAVLRLLPIPRADWSEVFAGLRIMERAALPLLNHRDQTCRTHGQR